VPSGEICDRRQTNLNKSVSVMLRFSDRTQSAKDLGQDE